MSKKRWIFTVVLMSTVVSVKIGLIFRTLVVDCVSWPVARLCVSLLKKKQVRFGRTFAPIVREVLRSCRSELMHHRMASGETTWLHHGLPKAYWEDFLCMAGWMGTSCNLILLYKVRCELRKLKALKSVTAVMPEMSTDFSVADFISCISKNRFCTSFSL